MTTSILLVSFSAPSRGHAGGLRLLDLYTQIRRTHPKIRLALLACKDFESDWESDSIKTIFNEVYWVSRRDFNSMDIKNIGVLERKYDVIDLQYHQAGALISTFKRYFHSSKIIFSPMESQIRATQLTLLSLSRNLKLYNVIRALFLASQELLYCFRADRVSCVSFADMETISFFIAKNKLFCVPTAISLSEINAKNDKIETETETETENELQYEYYENSLIYLAYFGSETNREALRWFCQLVHPLIIEKIPNYKLKVVGRGIDDALLSDCTSEGIQIIGEVQRISPAISSAVAGIAPALSGAGVRGKIHQYAALGVPTVTSKIGASGLKYKHGESIFIADSPVDFAACCIDLLTNQMLAKKMGAQAQQLCLSEYVWDSMDSRIKDLYCL